jgi:nucleotide-binding universal stress UspA family protein
MKEIKRILFPVDFTENSSKVSPYVLSISEKYDAEIYLLHVVVDFSQWGGYDISDIRMGRYREFQEEAFKDAETILERVCEEHLQDYPNFQKRILSGDPAKEILKFTESKEIDMVIMGTHGRKGLDHVFFGSVAENVLRKSPVPVLVINPHTLK